MQQILLQILMYFDAAVAFKITFIQISSSHTVSLIFFTNLINFLGCTATSTSGQFSEMSIENLSAIGIMKRFPLPKSSKKSNTAPLSSLPATNLKLCQFDAETKTESSSKSLPSQMKTLVKKGNINFTYNLAFACEPFYYRFSEAFALEL